MCIDIEKYLFLLHCFNNSKKCHMKSASNEVNIPIVVGKLMWYGEKANY